METLITILIVVMIAQTCVFIYGNFVSISREREARTNTEILNGAQKNFLDEKGQYKENLKVKDKIIEQWYDRANKLEFELAEARKVNGLLKNRTAYVEGLKELTSKRSKTDDDQNEIFHLKFLASCYVNNKGQYIIPANMISKSFEAGAKENKLGAKFQRSVFVFTDAVLKFDENGCTPEELWKNHSEKYVDIRPVGIMKSKIVTARMIIPEWSLEGELFFDESQLNKSEVWLAMTNAGLRYGIGTYRQCYGRYSIEEIKDENKKKKN